MQLLAWNIQAAGGARLNRILEEITAYDPDVIVLTAFRAFRAGSFRDEMLDRGWPHLETTTPPPNESGIAVFSRTPMRRERLSPAPPKDAARWLDVDFPEYGFGIGVLHIRAAPYGPSDPATKAKIRFWDAVLEAATSRLSDDFLFLGDWNTGAHFVDEPGKSFVCSGHFAKLAEIGWTDVWRHHNRGATEFTWYSKRKGGARGNGFRVDHAFATPGMLPRVVECRYSHVPREARISDHSMMVMEVGKRADE